MLNLPPADPSAGLQLFIQNNGANNAVTNTDITAQASQGKLGALLQIVNQTVPQYLGDKTQIGELNRLASSFANRVNAILTAGQVSSGPPVVQGSPLFKYTTETTAAASLRVDPSMTADRIATIDPGPPGSANGVATELANITDPVNTADLIDGQTFTSFYGELAGTAGAAAAQNSTDLSTQQDVTTQAENLRSQASGVSLNDQAAQLLTLQQAYQATAKIITVLEAISQTAVGIIPQA
jgi:flagellar hook-associated protein 1 FlgK